MSEVNFTKDEILTLRRALNALVTRQQLNLLAASEPMKEEIEAPFKEWCDGLVDGGLLND